MSKSIFFRRYFNQVNLTGPTYVSWESANGRFVSALTNGASRLTLTLTALNTPDNLQAVITVFPISPTLAELSFPPPTGPFAETEDGDIAVSTPATAGKIRQSQEESVCDFEAFNILVTPDSPGIYTFAIEVIGWNAQSDT